jgi:hypothetical protein
VELGREALTFFLTHATPDRLQEAHDEIWLSGLDGGNVVMAEAPELPALHYVTLGHRVAVPLGAWAGSAVCDKGTRVSRRWLPIAPSVAPFAIVCRACVGHVATCPDCRPKLRVPARF